MKKLILATGVVLYSLMSFAQTTAVQATDTVQKPATTPEQRINKLEAEIVTLKTNQIVMQKQLSEMQTTLQTTPKKKKLVVNRLGSKQLNWVEE